MTKERLRRLLEYSFQAGSGRVVKDEAEAAALRAEFDAWEPEPDPEPLELRVNCLEQSLVVVAKLVELLDDAMRAHIRSRSD